MKARHPSQKMLASFLLCGLYFSGLNSALAATYNISQKPLMLSETVAPNIVFTLDESGSMRWGFAPDAAGRDNSASDLRNTRRGMSFRTNPMYYNPNVTYRLPVKLNADGTTPTTGYTTSFTTAYQNGFRTGNGSINLSNNYRVSWVYDTDATSTNYSYSSTVNYAEPTGKIFNLSENPSLDFRPVLNLSLTGTNSEIITPIAGGGTVRITRSNNGCSASNVTATYSSLSCSRSSNNYTLDLTKTAGPAYYYVYDSSLANCNANVNNDNCHRLVFVSSTSGVNSTDERQNFAIWYSFYRTRALATVSAANLAFNELAPSARLTWQSLVKCNTLNSNDCGTNYFREFTPRHKANFLNWLASVQFDQSTPLLAATKRAGEFYTTATPWAHTPNPFTSNGGRGTTVTTPEYACRPSFHVLMTDGMWNDDSSPSGITRHDRASFKPGASTDSSLQYNGTRAPYGNDTTSNSTVTLADVAMHYWATDLRSGLANENKPYILEKDTNAETQFWNPKNNPATWQHMVNYTMGLGLTNALNATNLPWTGDTFGGAGYQRLAAGTSNWPQASKSSDNNVYDLWHAAVNSRGEFFSVDSPDDMVIAFKDILNRIADRTTSAARPAVSASFISDNINTLQSRVYATLFSSEDWSGEVTKQTINKIGTVLPGGSWSTRTANANLNPVQRKVFIKDSTASNGFKSFTWANLTTDQKNYLNINPDALGNTADNRGEARVNYVRGDRSQEGAAATNFRQRSSIMGDIINSSPALVGTPSYIPYLADNIESLDRGSSYQSYALFRQNNAKDRRKEMLYVGGNDGMLHGFESDTGKEVFAYIPSAVIQNLNKLSGQNYKGGQHQYFVDGSPVVRDVYFDNTKGWRTVLIGTLRAGGKALFALDVTDPDNIKLLWEFDSTTDEDLGFSFAQPEIVRLHSGQWAVLQANGYNSTNDKAALLVIDIQTGALLKKLVVPDTKDENGNILSIGNGLSSVRAADNNGDGIADYAYAGDLHGNVWRFDLVPSTNADLTGTDPFDRTRSELKVFKPASFSIAYGKEPIFVAKDKNGLRQPITIQPSIVRHPSNLGYLVIFGTGKYFEGSDATVNTSRAMTLYGIWDRKTRRQPTTSNPAARVRANLQKQEFMHQEANVEFGETGKEVANDIRILSQNTVEWYKNISPLVPTDDANVNRWGWRLDLAVETVSDKSTWDTSANRSGNQTLTGEMIVHNLAARGNTLLASSLTPNDDPCQAGADNWFYGINAHTGGRTAKNVLDLNNDRKFDSKDQYGQGTIVSGRRFSTPGGFTLSPGGVFGEGGQPPMTLPPIVGAPRQSWHIIPEEFQ